MARPLRIQFPGALYHIISRGNQRARIVLDEADREKRLEWLRRTVETYGWRLHAFVQLGNTSSWIRRRQTSRRECSISTAATPATSTAGIVAQGTCFIKEICRTVASHFGRSVDSWSQGTRSDDASRAVAAYVARRRFGYRACEVAQALGYRSHGSVRNALLRVEDTPSLSKSADTICRRLPND